MTLIALSVNMKSNLRNFHNTFVVGFFLSYGINSLVVLRKQVSNSSY
jgi:hypothetical protein